MTKLLFLNKEFAGKEYELLLEKTGVGRAPDNSLVIHDNSVSAHHCDILVHGTEVIVRERDSTNGTYVDGVRVSAQAPVKSGQVLRFGDVEVRLQLVEAKPRRDDTEVTTVYTLDELEREKRRVAKEAKRPTHGEVGDQSKDEEKTLVLSKDEAAPPGGKPGSRTHKAPHEPLYILPEPKRVSGRWLAVGIAAVLVLALLLYLLFVR